MYLSAVKLASLFNPKARLMVRGHSETFNILKSKIEKGRKYIWFHAASLGEFEQGRPLMERIRRQYPEYRILLTFFSPSGYEVRKDYQGADVICYLPFDTPRNAFRFVRLADPYMAFFIKYEFWQNYLKNLQRNHVPTYSVSSIFRKNQVFFRWYGGRYFKVLTRFTRLFVQNDTSRQLLASLNIHNADVAGDTRFDRVIEISKQAKRLPLVEQFKKNSMVMVAGSSWQPDEDILIRYFNGHPDMKLIIAPHVTDESHLTEIAGKLKRPYVRYTQATQENAGQADCLVIDCFGLLSSIYRYGEIAYVGGGFGAGIHNVLEAAVYGMPVLFGPNNQRYMEARQLLEAQGCFEIHNYDEFKEKTDRLMTDISYLKTCGKLSGDYVKQHAGASDKVMNAIEL